MARAREPSYLGDVLDALDPAGIFVLIAAYLVILGLHAIVPGRWVDGYVIDPATNRPLRYHLNGLRVFLVVVGGYALLCSTGVLAWDLFWRYRFTTLATAFVLGLAFSVLILVGAPPVKSLAADFYLGRRPNPQWRAGRVDAKMFLYLVGATMLELNLVSFAAHHLQRHAADPSPGVVLHVALFSFFLVEYLFFEEVHLYTYDFVAERVGFKLGWGCLVFYPFFYAIGLWTTAEAPSPHASPLALVGCALLFFSGWTLARGANMQKYWFKTAPEKKAFGLFTPEALAGRVLVNGFWGLSRHINYLGELLMASGLALSLGHPTSIGPWLYPLYYVALLVPRQLDDDARCAKKYGPLWESYRQRVPYRIIPWIY